MTGDILAATTTSAALGECPVWSAAESVLYWVDVDGRAVHRFDPDAAADETWTVPGRPGSLALTSEPGVLLVAMEHQLTHLDWATGASTPWLALEEPGTTSRWRACGRWASRLRV